MLEFVENSGNVNLPNSNQRDQLEDRRKSLEAKLREQKTRREASEPKSDTANFGNAIRLSTEFVVAILVGVGIGWTIDKFFGTAPWAMIIFLPLGFVAGVKNIMRASESQNDPDADSGKPDRE